MSSQSSRQRPLDPVNLDDVHPDSNDGHNGRLSAKLRVLEGCLESCDSSPGPGSAVPFPSGRLRKVKADSIVQPMDNPYGGYSMARLKTTVNKGKCIASGDCVQTAPGVFQLDDDGKSEVYDENGATDSVILAAARACPAKAIFVVDQDSSAQLFPPPKK